MAAAPPIEKVLVSFDEEWELRDYLERYLSTRRLKGRENVLDMLMECLARYPGKPPYRKSDLDYFLDANLRPSRRPQDASAGRKNAH